MVEEEEEEEEEEDSAFGDKTGSLLCSVLISDLGAWEEECPPFKSG